MPEYSGTVHLIAHAVCDVCGHERENVGGWVWCRCMHAFVSGWVGGGWVSECFMWVGVVWVGVVWVGGCLSFFKIDFSFEFDARSI